MKTMELKSVFYDTDELIKNNNLHDMLYQYQRLGSAIGFGLDKSPDYDKIIKERDKLLEAMRVKIKTIESEISSLKNFNMLHLINIPK